MLIQISNNLFINTALITHITKDPRLDGYIVHTKDSSFQVSDEQLNAIYWAMQPKVKIDVKDMIICGTEEIK